MWELGPDADDPEWHSVEVPFEKTLYEVVSTAEGPYAIGAGGTLLANRHDGTQSPDWEVVLDDGPKTRDNQLRGLDVTDDGKRIWFAGSSGALGCYDVVERRKYDYSSPKEMTSTWEGLAVAGGRGSEKVLVANGSGEILPFSVDGFDENWGVVHKPNHKGSKVAALAAGPDGYGYAVDTSGNAFRTTAEEGWEQIGIVNAQVKFYDIFAGRNGRVYVAAGDGRIYRYDDSYRAWTPIGVTDGTALRAFDVRGEQMVVLGNDGSIYQRDDEQRWQQVHSGTSNDLLDLSLGKPDVAVGKSGTVLQRPRGQTRHEGPSPDGDQYDGRGEYWDGDPAGASESTDGSSGGSTDGGSAGSGDSTDGSASESSSSTDGSAGGSGESTGETTAGTSGSSGGDGTN
ncbi:hypothetical protein [Halorussus sp. AFM4]|uniref:WD40/YVTN/BNR-like repeat-containing protein n=1 Tax=Halorussus sp. AFM4 TaxID=3421651 RepID=UPI003EC01CB4